MQTFVHLHTHSTFSLLDGTIPLRTLVERTKQFGMAAVALTDHNGLSGAIEFYCICREFGIKPIIGTQVDLTDGFSLVLLAKDMRGYRNLCEIITTANLRGGHLNFRCDLQDVLAHKEGLVVLSGGKKGLISQLVLSRNFAEATSHCRWMQQQFGNDFYLELQRFVPWDDFLNERLAELAGATGVSLVVTNDVHLLSQEEISLRQVLHAIDRNTLRERVKTAGSKEQTLKSPAQMRRLFYRYPEALVNTVKIADRCEVQLPLGKPVFPKLPGASGKAGFRHLKRLCLRGAKELYLPLTPQIHQRMDYELSVIAQLGFTDYFLIVKDIVDFCHRESIPCVGRGSAADSIVAYVLGITFADPIRFNLYFERFLNPERTDAPDIDLDICWKSRDRVLNYVSERYGKDKTAMICTYNTFQRRSAVREVSRTFGLPEEEISYLTSKFPYMTNMTRFDATLQKLPQLKGNRSLNRTYLEIIAISKRLAGFPRHLSIHAGGVIIAPDRITNYTPLEVAGKGFIISQYDMHSIERLGLVKMDLLGVRSLSIITECMEVTRASVNSKIGKAFSRIDDKSAESASEVENRTLEIADRDAETATNFKANGQHSDPHARRFHFIKKMGKLSPLDLRAIPDDDPATIAMIRAGKTLGCFQLESPLVRGLLRKMQTDNIEDVVVAVAVIRPGVGNSGMKDEYILRRGGLRQTRYIHPILEPILKETYGLTIYQEQVLLIARDVAGFTLAQADTLRRAMTKKRDDKNLMNTMKAQFISGAQANGIEQEKAGEVWHFLLNFIGFGFNKAHAATYGILAYQTAFLKCHFPVAYMTAVLNNHGGFYSKAVYIEECRRLILPSGQVGIPLLSPDVNRSEIDFSKEGDAIRLGFYPIFELSDKMKQRLIAARKERPFRDLYDFLRRIRAGQKETEHLIRCGAFRSLCPSEPLLLLKCQTYFKNGCNKTTAEYLTGGVGLPAYSREQRIVTEFGLLGFSFTAHPLTLYKDVIPWENMVRSIDLEKCKNRRVQFTGWYVTSRLQETVSGKYMKFLSLEDLFGVAEVIFFPEVYEKYADNLHGHGPFTVTGRVQSRIKGEANLIATKVLRWPPPGDIAESKIKGRQLDVFQQGKMTISVGSCSV